LLTASADKTCKLWDVAENKCITTFTFPNTTDFMQVGCLAQGDHLISVSLNGYINYLDRANPDKPLRVVRGHATNITAFGLGEGMMYVPPPPPHPTSHPCPRWRAAAVEHHAPIFFTTASITPLQQQ
jgi:hypothetical protein